MGRLDDALQRASKQVSAEDYDVLQSASDALDYLMDAIQEKRMSIDRLRKMLFGAATEKTATVLGEQADGNSQLPSEEDNPPDIGEDRAEPPRKGHGRNGVDAYPGAERIPVPHESLQPGDGCPECGRGTVYNVARCGVLLRITARAPMHARVYELQKLRCNLCGTVFTASPPEGVGPEKFDATVGSMIGLLKYGNGMPFNRTDGWQENLGVPLPASTQWDIVNKKARHLEPAWDELIRQAAQGDVVHNDDTTTRILACMGKRAEANPDERRGLFTSGIVSTFEGRRIALFFSGRQHAGENLRDVLALRRGELGRPIQMCDALSRNMPAELKTIVANCLAHGRRKFVDVTEYFPEECSHVLKALQSVYRTDATARQRSLTAQQRLELHQDESGPVMKDLHAWLTRQFADRLVEPNSSLGRAITYLLKYWDRLTLFLRVAGAPLDNNICERAIKKGCGLVSTYWYFRKGLLSSKL